MNEDYLKYGFYVRGMVPVVTERQVQCPENIRALRNYAASLGKPWRKWHEFLIDFYRDAPFIFVNGRQEEVFLDIEVFETESIDYWFRDFVKPVPPCSRTTVRKEAKSRVAVFASLMRAHHRMQAEIF